MKISVEEIPDDLSDIMFREADARECMRAGLTPEQAVRISAANSTEAYAVKFEGDVVAVWGWRGSPFGGLCEAWLLSTEITAKWEYRFARSSLRVVAHLLKRFHEIRVVVDLQHQKAIEWLTWLGFVERGRGDMFMEMVVTREAATWVS